MPALLPSRYLRVRPAKNLATLRLESHHIQNIRQTLLKPQYRERRSSEGVFMRSSREPIPIPVLK